MRGSLLYILKCWIFLFFWGYEAKIDPALIFYNKNDSEIHFLHFLDLDSGNIFIEKFILINFFLTTFWLKPSLGECISGSTNIGPNGRFRIFYWQQKKMKKNIMFF